MIEERRRILSSWHDHKGSVTLYITRHDDGAGPVYRLESDDREQGDWGSKSGAEDRAYELLREEGHSCSDRCQPWTAVLNQ